ncbi:MAG: RNA polymerase sigma factor [Bacteroidia bacterium]|nr:RNA polymerase sigma factor [Bacteroidia bacterium]
MKPQQLTEEQIVEGCLQGGRNYQKLLYEKYYGSMIVVCMRYSNDREEARDILHEGFMKVFANLSKYHRGTNLGAWVRRIMINTAIDHYRKASKRPALVEINQAIHEVDMSDVVSDLSAAEILGMVQKLSPAYRTVFNLYVIEGYSHKEVGDMLGISEGTSKSNLAKARGKLQAMIHKSRIIHKVGGEHYA